VSQGGDIIERMFDSMVLVEKPDGAIPDFDQMKPGPVLAGFLSSVNVNTLSGHDRIVVLRAHQRLANHYAEAVYQDMAAVSDSLNESEENWELANEQAAAEIRAALSLTRRAADHELDFAFRLRRRLPQVWEMLAAGEIDVRRARVIVSGTDLLPLATAQQVVEQVLEEAASLTTGQLAARLRRICIEADPDQARDRYNQAVAARRVVAEPTPDGTAHLFALDLPPDRVSAITDHINRLARSLRGPGDSRTMDQLRADVLTDLLAGSPGVSTGGVVDIRVDLTTLARLTDHPGELAGYGPVISDLARQIAETDPHSRWQYTITDADGRILTTGTTHRRPTSRQERQVEARHPTCIFPGCRMPATASDLDHTRPYSEGGLTTPDNLAPLCRHDHRIKHNAGWTYQRQPDNSHQWTTKLGHTYTTSGTPP